MAAIGLAACTQDELTDGTLPEGKYPLVINATGLQTATLDTRATVDGDWEGVEKVAVQVGDEVKEYSVTMSTDTKTATLSNDADPFYWEETSMTVSAWYPYDSETMPEMPEVVVQENQSIADNFVASDFISAENQTVNFGDDPTSLEFSHRTARVKVILEGTLLGDATVSLIDLTTEGGNPAAINAYKSEENENTFEVLLRPQTISAHGPFIQVVLKGETYSYGLEDGIELEANHSYTYNVDISAPETVLTSCIISGWEDETPVDAVTAEDYIIDDQGTYIVYTGAGLKAVADLINKDRGINVKLDRDIDLTGVDWKRISGYYEGTFDGQGHRITGLSINENEEFASLFSDIDKNGTVKNLQLEGVNYTATDESYGIAIHNHGTITACSVTGTLTASDVVAGIANNNHGTITACWFNGTLSASSSYGIAQYNSKLPTESNGGVISVCCWGGNAEEGVDDELPDPGTTTDVWKVDDGKWGLFIYSINTALTDNDYEWELGTDGLPVLKKK